MNITWWNWHFISFSLEMQIYFWLHNLLIFFHAFFLSVLPIKQNSAQKKFVQNHHRLFVKESVINTHLWHFCPSSFIKTKWIASAFQIIFIPVQVFLFPWKQVYFLLHIKTIVDAILRSHNNTVTKWCLTYQLKTAYKLNLAQSVQRWF